MALSASPVPAPRGGSNRPMKPTFKSMPDLSISTVTGSGGGHAGSNSLTPESPVPPRRTSESDNNQGMMTPTSAAATTPDDSDVLQQIVPVRDRRKMFEGVSDVSRLTPRRYGGSGGMGVSGAWPSMPSLTVRIKPEKPQPLPLVGAHTKPSAGNLADSTDLINHTHAVKGKPS